MDMLLLVTIISISSLLVVLSTPPELFYAHITTYRYRVFTCLLITLTLLNVCWGFFRIRDGEHP